jgi:lysozyme family protein
MTFDQAFEAVIGHEGGYVNNPKDPGGETRYGISKRAYPAEDIRNLTLARAKELYLRDYWLQAGCDKVPGGVAFDLFDTAVNSGVSRAVKLGPATLAAINAANAPALKGRFNGARLQFMTDLPEWVTFGKGWARRIASNLMRA